MGISVGQVGRMGIVVLFCSVWIQKCQIDYPAKWDPELVYGTKYCFLTSLNFLMLIGVNIILILGEYIPHCKSTSLSIIKVSKF